MHDSFDWMDVTIPESIYLSLLLDDSIHTLDLVYICTLLWMVAPMLHVHISEISGVFVLAGLSIVMFGSNVFS